jgi:hypothetical protein
MKKRILFAAAFLLAVNINAFAEEGMWLPQLLKQMNESDMKARGMKLSADDIYNINKSCIKDAVLSFGGFCTGSVISSGGLVLTNHHCGFGQIQAHSSVEKDYITNGFWANSLSDELPNRGLTATFIVRIEDVTSRVLKDVTPDMSENDRDKKYRKPSMLYRKKREKEPITMHSYVPFFMAVNITSLLPKHSATYGSSALRRNPSAPSAVIPITGCGPATPVISLSSVFTLAPIINPLIILPTTSPISQSTI